MMPLAERLRPSTLEEFEGQPKLLGKGTPLTEVFDSGRLHSMIFWGPPGTGKTTLARLLAKKYGCRIHQYVSGNERYQTN
jgi:putative ATPase